MNTLIDIFQAVVYLIVSLIIIFVLGVFYIGFVFFEIIKEIVLYINRRIQ